MSKMCREFAVFEDFESFQTGGVSLYWFGRQEVAITIQRGPATFYELFRYDASR